MDTDLGSTDSADMVCISGICTIKKNYYIYGGNKFLKFPKIRLFRR